MSCYHPMQVWYRPGEKVKFSKPKEHLPLYRLITIPCGQCIGCKLDHSKDWVCRLLMELETNPNAIFLTLTYDDKNCPIELKKRDLQNFFKRLRHYFKDRKIKYYACGEYGPNTFRPHYHLIIFGLDFFELDKHKLRDNLYTSDIISKIWKKGFISFNAVDSTNIAYTTHYTLKKAFKQTYDVMKTKNMIIAPEFQVCSKGLGLDYFNLKKDDILANNGHLFFSGIEYSLPRYFIDKLGEDSKDYKRIKKYNSDLASVYTIAHSIDDNWKNEKDKLDKIKFLKRKNL